MALRWSVAFALCAVFASSSAAKAQRHLPPQRPLTIPHVRSGRAILRQETRTTVFLLTSKNGRISKIALTHPSDYPERLYAPFAAQVVAEIPGQLLILTDSFASNPGNVQGKCGASDTGERFLHVLSLRPPARESFSVLLESCLQDIEPKEGTPEFDPSSRTLTLRFDTHNETPETRIYHIAADNSVKQ